MQLSHNLIDLFAYLRIHLCKIGLDTSHLFMMLLLHFVQVLHELSLQFLVHTTHITFEVCHPVILSLPVSFDEALGVVDSESLRLELLSDNSAFLVEVLFHLFDKTLPLVVLPAHRLTVYFPAHQNVTREPV
jgi:hypothetical protein